MVILRHVMRLRVIFQSQPPISHGVTIKRWLRSSVAPLGLFALLASGATAPALAQGTPQAEKKPKPFAAHRRLAATAQAGTPNQFRTAAEPRRRHVLRAALVRRPRCRARAGFRRRRSCPYTAQHQRPCRKRFPARTDRARNTGDGRGDRSATQSGIRDIGPFRKWPKARSA